MQLVSSTFLLSDILSFSLSPVRLALKDSPKRSFVLFDAVSLQSGSILLLLLLLLLLLPFYFHYSSAVLL